MPETNYARGKGKGRGTQGCLTKGFHLRVAIGRARAGRGSRLFDHALELDNDLRGDLVPKQASRVDVGSRIALALLSHGRKCGSEVAAMRRLRSWRQRVAEIVACDAVPSASEVHRGHTVVLSGRDGEKLLVLLLFA